MIKNSKEMISILERCINSDLYEAIKTYNHNYNGTKYELCKELINVSDSYIDKIVTKHKYEEETLIINAYVKAVSSEEFYLRCEKEDGKIIDYNSKCLLMDCYKVMIKKDSIESYAIENHKEGNVIFVKFN